MNEFPNVAEFNDTFREAAIACNGMLYHGDRLEAQIDLIKWLRLNPDKAASLLADYG